MLLWDDGDWRVQEMVRFEVEIPSLRPRSTVSCDFRYWRNWEGDWSRFCCDERARSIRAVCRSGPERGAMAVEH